MTADRKLIAVAAATLALGVAIGWGVSRLGGPDAPVAKVEQFCAWAMKHLARRVG